MSESDGHPPASFEARFAELAGLAYRVAYRIVGNREDASEIAQESLARAFGRWPRVRSHASGWVVTVATNLALDLERTRRRRAGRADHGAVGVARPTPGSLDSATALDAVADRNALVVALLALPRRQRDVVVLRYLADLSEAEVARQLGCSTGTVKTHAHRGLAALRGLLGDFEDGRVPTVACTQMEDR